MWRIVGNIVEMFVYASVYMLITIIAIRIVTAALVPDFEKRLGENNTGFSLICASLFIGMALLLSSILR